MHHIEGIGRDQITIFPEALDDYIIEDNPVRFPGIPPGQVSTHSYACIASLIESLDLSSLGFQRVIHPDIGRPPCHPGEPLRL